MALGKEEKQQIFSEFGLQAGDTGSTSVQVALLTRQINRLSEHLQGNRHDFHSHRGLLMMVGQRKRLLSYLVRTEPERHHKLIQALGIRK